MRVPYHHNSTFNISQQYCQNHPENICQYIKLSIPFNTNTPVTYRPSSIKLNNRREDTDVFACQQCLRGKHHQGRVSSHNMYGIKNREIPQLKLKQFGRDPQTFLSFRQFYVLVCKFVETEKKRIIEEGEIIQVQNIIDNKRKKIKSMYNETKIKLINQLSEDEDIILEELKKIEEFYQSNENKVWKILQKRDQSLGYFNQFAKNYELLKMKLYMSTNSTLNTFIQQIKAHENMQEYFQKRNVSNIMTNILRDVDHKLECSILNRIQSFLKHSHQPKKVIRCSSSDKNLPRQKSNSSLNILTQRNQSFEHLPNIPHPKTARKQNISIHIPIPKPIEVKR